MSKVYSSNLTLEQWQLIEPLIPLAKSGGRPRAVEVWKVLNAIFYLLTQGCTWRNLPGDFPAWQTVYRYFRAWRNDGTWVRIQDRLATAQTSWSSKRALPDFEQMVCPNC
jgi:transposase